MFLSRSNSLYSALKPFHTGITSTIRNKSGEVESTIIKKLQAALQTTHLDVVNEVNNEIPHFSLVVVTDQFHGLPMYKARCGKLYALSSVKDYIYHRHNLIHEILKEELQAGIHISSIVARTPIQWHRSLAAKEHSQDS